ncbi:hypothetical protein [Mycolicibacterium sp. HS_4_1]
MAEMDARQVQPLERARWQRSKSTRLFRAQRFTVPDIEHRIGGSQTSEASVKVVQRTLGHSSAAMTLDVDADLFDDDLTGVADKLDETVGRM